MSWRIVAATLGAVLVSSPAAASSFDFGPSTEYRIAADPDGSPSAEAIEIGDVTGDGRAEIVVTTSRHSDPGTEHSVLVFSRREDGSLSKVASHEYAEFANWASLVLADMDEDGILDIVVGHLGGLDVLLAQGDGQFQSFDVETEHDCLSVIAVDANLDGNADIVCLEWAGRATVVHGNGNGGIAGATVLDTGANGYNDMEAGDVTGDGYPDLVITSRQSNDWFVHPHDGQSGFREDALAFTRPDDIWSPSGVAIGDFNGDARNDVAVATPANQPDSRITFYFQDANGILGAPSDVASFDLPVALIAADLDRNGLTDLVVGHHGWNEVGRYMQEDGALAPEILAESAYQGFAYGMAVGDVDADGCLDAATIEHAFGFSVVLGICPQAWSDLDGDARSDLFWRDVSTGDNVVWRGADHGDQMPIARMAPHWVVGGLGDFDGDGSDDILWRNLVNGLNQVWSAGNHEARIPILNVRDTRWKVDGIGDLDGDGKDDVVWRHFTDGRNQVWLSANARSPQRIFAVRNIHWLIAGVADFDGDGQDDLLWHNEATGANTIWRSGNPKAQDNITDITDLAWDIAGVGDFDGDGRGDILWRHSGDGRNVYWRGGQFGDAVSVRTVADPDWEVAATGDYDGDGESDIVWRHARSGRNILWRSADPDTQLPITNVLDTDWEVMP